MKAKRTPQIRRALTRGLADQTARNLTEVRARITVNETPSLAGEAMELYEEIAGSLDTPEWVKRDFDLTYLVALRHMEAVKAIGPAFDYQAQVIRITPGKGRRLKPRRAHG